MINRTAMPVSVWPTKPQDESMPVVEGPDRESTAHTISFLLRFLAAVVLICGLTCLYIWELSNVSELNLQTRQLDAEVTRLEQENVTLMLQVAAQDTPAEIEARARALGMTPFKQPVYVALPPESPVITAQPVEDASNSQSPAAWLEQFLNGLLNSRFAVRDIQVASSNR